MIHHCLVHSQTGCTIKYLRIPFLGYLRLSRRWCFAWFIRTAEWERVKEFNKL